MQIFTRGETIAIAVRNVSNVPFVSARADLKKSDLSGDAVLEFDVTYHEDLGGSLGPGWLLKAGPEKTVALEPAVYATDLRVVLTSEDVEISEIEQVQIKAGVTETP